jgi:outer membrane protein TolC
MEERNMSAEHNPREEFVNQLEHHLRADLRRRDRAPRHHPWIPQSRNAVALVFAAVAIVSMAVGGGVVAVAYEARLNEQRDLLLGNFEQRAILAQQQLALRTQLLRDMEQRVSVGIEPQESVLDVRFKVREAEAELKSIEVDIEEIRATGREPMNALSAPLISGRDFVTERLRVEMSVPAAALEVEKVRAQAVRSRFEVGLAHSTDVDAAETRTIELASAIEVFQRKMGIRQTFLKGGLTAAVADLRGLEAETDMRRTALARRIDFARRQVREVTSRIEVGTANPLNLAEAELRLQELQLEMSRADYDLLLIRKQLGK